MRYLFPPDEGPLNPAWTAPIESVAKALSGSEQLADAFFEPADFMIMCRIVRPPRPSIVL